LAHGPPGNPSGGPSCLEIETSGQAIQVQKLSSEIESRANAAFHGFEIHFSQTHTAASNKLIFIEALADHLKLGTAKLLNKLMLGRARKTGPPGLSWDPGAQNQLFPKPCRQASIGNVDHQSGGVVCAPGVQLKRKHISSNSRQPVNLQRKGVINGVQLASAPCREPEDGRPAYTGMGDNDGTPLTQAHSRHGNFNAVERNSRQILQPGRGNLKGE
jgi:hypothetical protein